MLCYPQVFGPVVVAVPFTTEAEAVALANDSPYGLAAAIWTTNVMRAHRVADKLDVRRISGIWIKHHMCLASCAAAVFNDRKCCICSH